ncbi:MAG: rRNA adenine N-6-methyltransferase family protein [bacterium]|nr:rRNA adenine N-6-methyltransferase family protein [bacterium]
MNGKLQFALNFLLHPVRNASLVPSSHFASKAMLLGIDFSSVQTVVELGPGTGVFTEEILKRCKPDTKVLLIELEKDYITLLEKKFGNRVLLENASAHLLDAILLKYGIAKVDLIVSGLPFSLPHEVKEKLFASLGEHTSRGTHYRFFTYNPPLMKRVYAGLPIRKISFVSRNLPPLWVYGIN